MLPQQATARLRALATGTTPADALTLFDALPAVDLAEVIGSWRGSELPTGHPFGGALERVGWHGKRFRGADEADPLVMDGRGKQFLLNPRFVPMGLVARLGPLLRVRPAQSIIRAALPLLSTAKPRARLRMVEYRGVVTATMCYDALPIHDHFRRVDDDTVLGAMDLRGVEPAFLFVLYREGHPT